MKETDKKPDKKSSYIPEKLLRMETNFLETYYKEQVEKEERLIFKKERYEK